MHKAVVVFLLAFIIILALTFARKNPFNKRQEISAASSTHVYPGCARGYLSAILVLNDLCTSAVSGRNTSLPKANSGDYINFAGVNFILDGGHSFVDGCTSLQQKKYLFYIYPSHNFW